MNSVDYTRIYFTNMSTTGYNTRNRVACIRCKQRHKPPVGASCTWEKAIRKKVKSIGQQKNGEVINLGTVDAALNPTTSSHGNTTQPQITVAAPTQKSTKSRQPSNSEV